MNIDEPVAAITCFNGSCWVTSLYSHRKVVNVREICESLGGGGHDYAAGFESKELPF